MSTIPGMIWNCAEKASLSGNEKMLRFSFVEPDNVEQQNFLRNPEENENYL